MLRYIKLYLNHGEISSISSIEIMVWSDYSITHCPVLLIVFVASYVMYLSYAYSSISPARLIAEFKFDALTFPW